MSRAYIAAGSNLGSRFDHLETAFQNLCRCASLRSVLRAPIYETIPVGGPEQNDFLNTLWIFETVLEPEAVLGILQGIEQLQGRVRAEKNGPRKIDLDLVAYDEKFFDQNGLCIPHARMHERWFVLKPLWDVAPHWKHPLLHKTVSELLAGLNTPGAGSVYKTTQPEKK